MGCTVFAANVFFSSAKASPMGGGLDLVRLQQQSLVTAVYYPYSLPHLLLPCLCWLPALLFRLRSLFLNSQDCLSPPCPVIVNSTGLGADAGKHNSSGLEGIALSSKLMLSL